MKMKQVFHNLQLDLNSNKFNHINIQSENYSNIIKFCIKIKNYMKILKKLA